MRQKPRSIRLLLGQKSRCGALSHADLLMATDEGNSKENQPREGVTVWFESLRTKPLIQIIVTTALPGERHVEDFDPFRKSLS